MTKNNIDYVVIGLIGVLCIAGIFFVNEWIKELDHEANLSKEVASNWRALDVADLDCGEMQVKLISLGTENFQGVDLIIEAIQEKRIEKGC